MANLSPNPDEDTSRPDEVGSSSNNATPSWNNPYIINPSQTPPAAKAPLPSNPYLDPTYRIQMYQQRSQYYPANQPAKSNWKAIASFVISLLTFFGVWFLPVIGTAMATTSVIFGHKALAEMNYPSGDRGLAVTGLILGYLCGVLSLFVTGFWLIVQFSEYLA